MIKQFVFYSFCSIYFMLTESSYAAAIVARVQEQKAMQQQQEQAQYEQQVQQYQQYQQQAEQVQQAQQQQAVEQQTYQQEVDERNQAIAQAVSVAQAQALANAAAQQQAAQVAAEQAAQGSNASSTNTPAVKVKDVVDLAEVWKKLDKKSTVWTLLIDQKDKVLTVSEYIDRYQKQGVKINQPPLHYVDMIDQMIQQNPGMLQRPFSELLQIAAIVDYDFDNGMDKDDLARKILGEDAFDANKRRFGAILQ